MLTEDKHTGGSVPQGMPDNLDEVEQVSTDFQFDKADLAEFDRWNVGQLKKRDKKYSDILGSYYSYTNSVLTKNPTRQSWFFWISVSFLIGSPLQFLGCLIASFWFPNAVVLIASVVEVIAALMVFPQIVAEYLFNTNETTSVNDIVTAIQNYDIEVRKGIRHTVESGSDTSEQ